MIPRMVNSSLSDGYMYTLDSQYVTVPEVDEWITMEALCCPFLTFAHGDGQLTLRGPEGAKAVLREEFPEKANKNSITTVR
jgi:hypothetical protein